MGSLISKSKEEIKYLKLFNNLLCLHDNWYKTCLNFETNFFTNDVYEKTSISWNDFEELITDKKYIFKFEQESFNNRTRGLPPDNINSIVNNDNILSYFVWKEYFRLFNNKEVKLYRFYSLLFISTITLQNNKTEINKLNFIEFLSEKIIYYIEYENDFRIYIKEMLDIQNKDQLNKENFNASIFNSKYNINHISDFSDSNSNNNEYISKLNINNISNIKVLNMNINERIELSIEDESNSTAFDKSRYNKPQNATEHSRINNSYNIKNKFSNKSLNKSKGSYSSSFSKSPSKFKKPRIIYSDKRFDLSNKNSMDLNISSMINNKISQFDVKEINSIKNNIKYKSRLESLENISEEVSENSVTDSSKRINNSTNYKFINLKKSINYESDSDNSSQNNNAYNNNVIITNKKTTEKINSDILEYNSNTSNFSNNNSININSIINLDNKNKTQHIEEDTIIDNNISNIKSHSKSNNTNNKNNTIDVEIKNNNELLDVKKEVATKNSTIEYINTHKEILNSFKEHYSILINQQSISNTRVKKITIKILRTIMYMIFESSITFVIKSFKLALVKILKKIIKLKDVYWNNMFYNYVSKNFKIEEANFKLNRFNYNLFCEFFNIKIIDYINLRENLRFQKYKILLKHNFIKSIDNEEYNKQLNLENEEVINLIKFNLKGNINCIFDDILINYDDVYHFINSNQYFFDNLGLFKEYDLWVKSTYNL